MYGLSSDDAARLERAALRFAAAAQICDPRAQFGPTVDAGIDTLRARLPIGRELAHWYAFGSPQSVIYIPAFGNDRKIYPPTELIDAQMGYRWEWSTSEQVIPLDGWKSSWIVIGDVGGDPIIADTSESGSPILMSMHGQGIWTPYVLAPTIATFLEAQAIWITVCLVETGAIVPTAYGVGVQTGCVWDEQGELLPDLSQKLESKLREVLSSDCMPAWLE